MQWLAGRRLHLGPPTHRAIKHASITIRVHMRGNQEEFSINKSQSSIE